MIYFLQCEEDKGRGFWLFKADDNRAYLTGASTCMYFMYNRIQKFNELKGHQLNQFVSRLINLI